MFITNENLKQYLLTLSKKYKVVVPTLETFEKPPILALLGESDLNRLELKVRPLIPYKFFFQPPSEEVFTYNLVNSLVKLSYEVEEHKNLLLIGLRNCDLKALDRLDMVMLEDPVDSFYKVKGENVILISVDCIDPPASCFCTEVGLKPFPEEGYDLNLSEVNGGYLVDAGSRKGEELLRRLESLFVKESKQQLRQSAKRKEAAYRRVKKSYNNPIKDLSRVKDEYFNDFTKCCVECSGCIFTCPTCYCFYVSDEKRKELWTWLKTTDSCMSEAFQRVAAGLNPRATLNSRLRQRFLHKFVYFKERYDEYGCVGCGRCFEVCPGEIDIREAADLI